MDPDRSGRPFRSIANDVVTIGPNPRWIGFEEGKIVRFGPREWMVSAAPPLVLGVPFDERKVEHPAKVELPRVTKAAALPYLHSEAIQHIISRFPRVGDEAEQVALLGLRGVDDRGKLFRLKELG